MKAVILAAGVGSRLRPITNDIPKCMVSVNGIRIIDKQIDNLLKVGINEIYVVSGYKHDILIDHLIKSYPFVTIVENPYFDKTNNMYSLFLTLKFVKNQEFLLMNSDVYYDEDILKGMLNDKNCSKIACDRSQYLEESMKVTVKNGIINHISKKIKESEYFAVSIDVYRISSTDSNILFEEIENTIVRQKDKNSWTEVALDRIFDRSNFYPYVINGRWYEIDNYDDLALAEKIFSDDKINS